MQIEGHHSIGISPTIQLKNVSGPITEELYFPNNSNWQIYTKPITVKDYELIEAKCEYPFNLAYYHNFHLQIIKNEQVS
jgi:hypothetical protein